MDEKDIKIENLEKQVVEMKENEKDFEKRLTLLEKNTAVSEEQIKMIYKILNEIKDSITNIANKLDAIEQEPGKEAKKIKSSATSSAISAFVGGIVGAVLSLLIKK